MVLKEGEDPENCDKECKKKGYLVVLFKSCWYTVTLFIAICAASVILMGIEGNHLKYTNLNKYRLREDFDKRLLEVSMLNCKMRVNIDCRLGYNRKVGNVCFET